MLSKIEKYLSSLTFKETKESFGSIYLTWREW